MLFPIRPQSFLFTIVLGLLAALPALSLDISIPTLITVQRELLASPGTVGLTISLFMIGFAIGQFGGGPLSDRFGRKPVLLSGLAAYVCSRIACAASATVEQLVGWRCLQGVGAGCCAVMAFTIIRDLFEGDVARSKRSYVTVVFGLAPMLAPGLGALVMSLVGWRPVFLVLTVGGLALLIVVLGGVPESRPNGRIRSQVSLLRVYGIVLADRRFVGLAFVNAFSFAALFAYIAGSPLVLMGSLQLSATQYAAFFACTAATLTGGAWASGRLAARGLSPVRLLWFSLLAAATSSTVLAVLVALGFNVLSVLVPLLIMTVFCRGLTAPNAQHMALEPMPDYAGTAAAAVGVVQIVTGAAGSALVAVLFPFLGPLSMTGVMAVCAVAALALWGAVSRPVRPLNMMEI